MVKNVNELMKGHGRGHDKGKRKSRQHKFVPGTSFKFGKNGQTYIKHPK